MDKRTAKDTPYLFQEQFQEDIYILFLNIKSYVF